jgi:hypothetical protein
MRTPSMSVEVVRGDRSAATAGVVALGHADHAD